MENLGYKSNLTWAVSLLLLLRFLSSFLQAFFFLQRILPTATRFLFFLLLFFPIFTRKPSATPLFPAQQPQKLQPPPWRGPPASSRAPCSCSSKKPGPPFKCHPPGASQVAGRLNINAYIYIYIYKQSQRGGLQICPSSVKFTSAKNMNTEVKRKCE